MNEEIYYIYILESENGNYYTGYTKDLKARYLKHLTGKGAKFTRAFKPKCIVKSWKLFDSKSNAMKVEALIKRKKRDVKEDIIKKPGLLKKMIKEELELNLKIRAGKRVNYNY